MEKFIIRGGAPLNGCIRTSGSKNAALPLLAASVLGDGPTVLHNVPALKDIRTMLKILSHMGASIVVDGHTVEVDPRGINRFTAPYDFVSTMRGSVALLGPVLAKFGQIRFSMPGGCVIGSRPIDLHIKGLRKLGVELLNEEGDVVGKVGSLTGTTIFLGGNFGSSVLATANIMCAATLAHGTTTIEFAACEPEIRDLALFLKRMGAHISGEGSHLVTIEGVPRLSGVEYTVMPDRIEAGTYALAGAITGGSVRVDRCNPGHLLSLLEKLEESGAGITRGPDFIETRPSGRWKSFDVVTLPYPGFPTDLQAQIMAFLTVADGIGVITEKVFPERFIHVGELNRLGADIALDGSKAIVRGTTRLHGARVMASDLRASAALVLGGLAADGETEIARIYHLDRGYERFDEKLNALGANIRRVNDTASA